MSNISNAAAPGPGLWKRVPGMRKCTRCFQRKPGEEFQKRKPNEAPHRRFQWCAACLLIPRRIETEEASGHTYKTKQEVIRAAKDKPCVDCGIKYHFSAMDFDHTHGEKSFNLAAPAGWTYGEILEEIAKCDVVCSNCHRIRTYERGAKNRAYATKAPQVV